MTIPTNLRVPFVAVEFDSSRAFQGVSVMQYKGLLVGQKTSSGSAATGTFLKLTKDVPNSYFGAGSDLARMANKFFSNNKFTEVYAYAYADPPSGSAATGTITIAGIATADGELALMIDGIRVPVTVAVDDTAAVIASAIVTAITANTELPVTAVAAQGVVTLTAKNVGVIGNNIDVRKNYYDGELTPAGITATIAAMADGAGSIDLSTMIANLGDEWFQGIACSAVDTTNLGLIDVELAERFGALRMKDGMYFCSRRGTGETKAAKLQELIDFGTALNSKHVTCMNATSIPNDPAEVVAAYLGQALYELSVNPARPLQTLELVGILPPAKGERNDISDDNSLLWDGISTFECITGNKVLIQRAITMYQVNASGSADIAYLDVNTLFTLMHLRYDFRTRIRTKYPRAILANDGTRVKPGLQVITPKVGKAEAIAIFRTWEYEGWVEGIEQFKRDLICQRSSIDPNRLEWVLPPDLANQFVVGAVSIQFLLQDTSL